MGSLPLKLERQDKVSAAHIWTFSRFIAENNYKLA
jgi:hypothetical protein